MILPTLPLRCCICGSPDLLAVAVGTEGERVEMLDLTIRRAIADAAWCAEHWQRGWRAAG